jgi:hypothetical protein
VGYGSIWAGQVIGFMLESGKPKRKPLRHVRAVVDLHAASAAGAAI